MFTKMIAGRKVYFSNPYNIGFKRNGMKPAKAFQASNNN